MNSLARIDQELLESIKKDIERASGLENKVEWVQKDYDFLVFFIEDKTGVRLSLSTIKRIWRNEHNRLPHISTLDTLSKLAYKKDWLSLKKQWLERGHRNHPQVENSKGGQRNPIVYIIAILALVIFMVVGLSLALSGKDKISIEDKEKVVFSYKKSVDGKIPNTVVFTYNVQSIKADRFFLQQSWDKSRRVEILKDNTEQTDIYYVPGYFTARLLTDTEVIKEIPVHVTCDDWFIAARQPMSNIRAFDKKHWLDEKYLGVGKAALKSKKIDLAQDFQLSFYQVRDFGLDGDNFSYTSRFKMDPVDAIPCPNISLHVQGDKGYYWIMFGNKGCESELVTQLSEVNHNGKNQDLTMFGTNVYQWQQVGINVNDKKVGLQLNGETIFSSEYSLSIGSIKEISYFFVGVGAIDDVELRDAKGKISFSDDFE